jgi:hypothetical protein
MEGRFTWRRLAWALAAVAIALAAAFSADSFGGYVEAMTLVTVTLQVR